MTGRRVLAVANQKGGVGKTTSAINLAAALALAGEPTLLVDLDPQSNATSGLGVDPAGTERNVYTVLAGDCTLAEAAVASPVAGLTLVPASRDLVGAEIELVGAERREERLRLALAEAGKEINQRFILLDCPPSLGLLTVNALTTADGVLVPLQCEYYALEGLSALLGTIEAVRASLNPRLELEGVLLTMFDVRNSICHQVAGEAREHLAARVFETVIPRSVRLSEAPSHGLPIQLYDPGSRGAASYAELAREVRERAGGTAGPAR